MNDKNDHFVQGETPAQEIRQEIQVTRQAIGEKIDELETRARETFDLHHQMQNHPLVLLGTSTGAGFLLGALTNPSPNSPRRQSRHLEAPDPVVRDVEGSPKSSQIRDGLKAAAISLVAGYVKQVLREHAPAWGDQVERVWQQHGLDGLLAPPNPAAPKHPAPESPARGPAIEPRNVH